jgi:hypothetical protein
MFGHNLDGAAVEDVEDSTWVRWVCRKFKRLRRRERRAMWTTATTSCSHQVGLTSHVGGGAGHLDSSPANIRTAV